MASGDQWEKFRKTLWPKIEDASSAREAMKLAQWVGVLIAIGYAMALVVIMSADKYPDGTPIDANEQIGFAFMFVVLLVLALVFWYLVRRGLGWAVLVLSVWGIVEAVLKLATASGGGIVLTILLILFCISGFRGWAAVRKYGGDGGPPQESTAAG